MELAERFRRAVDHEVSLWPGPLFPLALARAVTTVLPIAGAAITVVSDYSWLPMASSDLDSMTAERWEFTYGEGPGFAAHQFGESVVATESVLATRWPLLHDTLRRRSPYRSVVALPLPSGPARSAWGVLSLYLLDPAPWSVLDLAQVEDVATLLPPQLFGQHAPDSDPLHVSTQEGSAAAVEDYAEELRARWQTASTRQRHDVWVAVGMCMHTLHLSPPDALSVLRARALSMDRTLDAVASAVVDGHLPLPALDT